jgi:hypothetical protein
MSGYLSTPPRDAEVKANNRLLQELRWRRRSDLDEAGREAWQIADGTVLLLDPSGNSDSLIRPCPPEPQESPREPETERLARLLAAGWNDVRRMWK